MSVIYERDNLTVDEQTVSGTPVLWVKVGKYRIARDESVSALNRDDVLDLYATLHRWLKDTQPPRKLLGPRGI